MTIELPIIKSPIASTWIQLTDGIHGSPNSPGEEKKRISSARIDYGDDKACHGLSTFCPIEQQDVKCPNSNSADIVHGVLPFVKDVEGDQNAENVLQQHSERINDNEVTQDVALLDH